MTLELLTVADLSKRLKLSRNKIYELIRMEKIESLKLDKSRRFTEEQVTRYLAGVVDEVSRTNI